MLDTICEFCERLLPLRREGATLYPDDTHRITITEKAGNPVFIYDTHIAGEWLPMGTIEIETGQKHFWTRVVEALKTYTGATFAIPDPLVASMAVGLPGADLLTQERARETVVLPRTKPKAGAKLPDFEGTIKSTRKTKTHGGPENDEDVIDGLAMGCGD